jgi:Phosphodiester glycosidase
MTGVTGSAAGHRIPRSRRRRRRWVRRHRVLTAFLALFVVFAAVVGPSLGTALTNPALGSSVGARLAEWTRTHGGNGMVNWIENVWYSHHQPKAGGAPPKGAIKVPTSTTQPAAAVVAHLPAPDPIIPPASPPLPGEGQWSPAGRTVSGSPTVYLTRLRPDAVHTSLVAGVAWMDTKLLRAQLYSGSFIPGGGPFAYSAPVKPDAAATLVAAFNSGFQMSTANGGYYTEGRTVVPLRNGAASFVITKEGVPTVVQWGRDATMTPDIASVRQNLDLLVDGGRAEPTLNPADTTRWGFTLGNQIYVWRSGVGVTADGALVYVGGPGLNITTLADLLVRAGAVRAMELDINTDWVHLATYGPAAPDVVASAANGTNLLPNMVGTPSRYFETWWSRDFFTMSVVPTPVASPPSTSKPGASTRTSRSRLG